MKNRKYIAGILASMLLLTSCGGGASKDVKTPEPTKESNVTQEVSDSSEENKESSIANEKIVDTSSLPSFVLNGREIAAGERTHFIDADDKQGFVDAPIFVYDIDGDIYNYEKSGQSLVVYAEEENTSLSNDELLDYFFMEKGKKYFEKQLDSANVVKSYEVKSKEEVDKGGLACTHYIGEFTATYDSSIVEEDQYYFDMYCFNFLGLPCFVGGIQIFANDYEPGQTYLDAIRKDITQNTERMLLSVRTNDD